MSDGFLIFPDLTSALLVLLGFVAGGLAKGVFGLGMPFVGLPFMVVAIPFQTAIALFLVPNFTANGQQMFGGGKFAVHLRRWAGLIVPMLAVIPFSVKILLTIDQDTAVLILGLVSVVFALLQIMPFAATIDPKHERWLNPIVGMTAGSLAGISGLYGPVVIIYLMALRVPKDEFVASMGLIYFMGSVALYGSLAAFSIITRDVLIVSAVGAVIIGAMILLAERIRARIAEARYRKLILILLMIMGADMIRRGLVG
ncbi:MAG: sulfite exporter TauE/SafE family protein [Rhodospirillaceae bacterium]|nr:sulfite exporter TauE/SafE family protein [Rhodospirillaceae bacterium]